MRASRRLLLGLSLCGATPLVAGADDGPRRLTIHWSDPEAQFPFSLSELAAEAGALFAPLGIALEWTSAEVARAAREDVQVILLAEDRSKGRMGTRAMACVQMGARSGPTAWILVPRVRALLGLPPRRLSGEGPMLGRALARVMAHELVHLLAPSVPHARRGLMNESLGRDFLVRRATPVIDAGLARAVRTALADDSR